MQGLGFRTGLGVWALGFEILGMFRAFTAYLLLFRRKPKA